MVSLCTSTGGYWPEILSCVRKAERALFIPFLFKRKITPFPLRQEKRHEEQSRQSVTGKLVVGVKLKLLKKLRQKPQSVTQRIVCNLVAKKQNFF